MKITLSLLLFVVYLQSNGQKTDSSCNDITIGWHGGLDTFPSNIIIGASEPAIFLGAIYDTVVAHDTIKIIMLCSDTTNGMLAGDASMMVFSNRVFWKYGFQVKVFTGQYRDVWLGMSSFGNEPIFVHKEYLDAKRKTLPKSIIIWMVKEIKSP